MKEKRKRILTLILAITVAMLAFIYKADISVEDLKKEYANDASQFITIDGMQVHYRDEGDRNDSIPLVLIHGTAASLHTWDACTEKWKGNHRVIRFDLPAFGLTGPNKENDYSIERYIAFVDAFLNSLSIKKCYLVGNSLGGRITWEYTLSHPDKVEKMVLVDAAGYSFDRTSSGTLAFKLGKVPVLKNILKFLMSRSVVEKSVKSAYFDDSKVTDDIVDRYVHLALREGNRSAFVARMNQPYEEDKEAIKSIQTPTLIIWGEEDALIPVECAYKFEKDLPNVQLVVLQNEGHVPMDESPERVIPLVENFIGK